MSKQEAIVAAVVEALVEEIETFGDDQIREAEAISTDIRYLGGGRFTADISLYANHNRTVYTEDADDVAAILRCDQSALERMAAMFLAEGWVEDFDSEDEVGEVLATCGCCFASKDAVVYEHGVLVRDFSDPHTKRTWVPLATTLELADAMALVPHDDARRTLLALSAVDRAQQMGR